MKSVIIFLIIFSTPLVFADNIEKLDLKYDISPISEPRQSLIIDPTFGYTLSPHKLIQPPIDFIYMLILFGLIAVVGTIIIIKFDKITQHSHDNVEVKS